MRERSVAVPDPAARIAVIGGSGFYEMAALTEREEWRPITPFGEPSSAITLGQLHGTPVAFLPRHGSGHFLTPGEIPVRANIWALKSLGVQGIIAVSAVGSLQEAIAPSHMVVPDQIIDRTRGDRPVSFFSDGIVAHVGFADPFCPDLSERLATAGGSLAAAGIGKHFGNVHPFLLSLVAIAGGLLLLADSGTMTIYSMGCCLFALAFGAGLPFAIAEIAELDVDGRYVILSVPAIGTGAMIGPGVAGLLYTGESARLILGLVALAMVIAAGLMWNAHRNKRC